MCRMKVLIFSQPSTVLVWEWEETINVIIHTFSNIGYSTYLNKASGITNSCMEFDSAMYFFYAICFTLWKPLDEIIRVTIQMMLFTKLQVAMLISWPGPQKTRMHVTCWLCGVRYRGLTTCHYRGAIFCTILTWLAFCLNCVSPKLFR